MLRMNMVKRNEDIELLAVLGYKQEFKRAFRPLEIFGIAFSIIGIVPSAASTLSLSLPYGGSIALIWGWVVTSFFGMVVAFVIAELSSAAPTAGGLYFWTFKYAPPRWRHVLSWVVGYSNTMGLTTGIAGVVWACAVQLMAAVSIGTDLKFTPTTGQLYGLYVALYILTAIIASVATKTLARLQGMYTALNILLCLGIIIALPVSTPRELKNSAADVFGHFSNVYSWPSGFAFLIGFAGPLWVMAGYDAPVHMSEEASNAATAVPTAIVTSLGASILLGFGINFALAFNMGTDIESIMASPIGQPMAVIFFNSLGTKGTLAVWSSVVIAQFAVAANFLVACSRQVFAFSRDGALPFSRYLYRVNSYTQTPVNCVWALTLCGLLLGLLAFAGSSAINAIFSLGIIGAFFAYCILISCRLFGPAIWRPGPFSIGKWSTPVTVTALIWCIFATIIVLFPASTDPNGETMNYTIVVGGGWIGFCILYFYFPKYGGMYWFKGPTTNIGEDSTVEIVGESVEGKDEKYSEE